jgi:hypothetical protein
VVNLSLGFFQLIDVIFQIPDVVVIEGIEYREEIAISQGFLTIERLIDLCRSGLIFYQGWYILQKINSPLIKNAKDLVNKTVLFTLCHFFLISFQFYISCFLLQDVIKTWSEATNKDFGRSKEGTFTYSRQKLHSGYISQDMEILEEQVDISLIALGLVFGFLVTLC